MQVGYGSSGTYRNVRQKKKKKLKSECLKKKLCEREKELL